MSITNGEGTLNMGGIIYYYYFIALGEAYGGGALYSLESVFFLSVFYICFCTIPGPFSHVK